MFAPVLAKMMHCKNCKSSYVINPTSLEYHRQGKCIPNYKKEITRLNKIQYNKHKRR